MVVNDASSQETISWREARGTSDEFWFSLGVSFFFFFLSYSFTFTSWLLMHGENAGYAMRTTMHEKSRYIRSVNIINLKQVLVGLPPGLFRIVLQKQNLSYGS
jgi:hypothetical protein